MIEIYYDHTQNTHFFTGDNKCRCCNEDLFGKAIHVAMTCLMTERTAPRQYRNTLVLKTKLLCHNCVCKKKKIYDVIYWVEIREVTIQTIPPNTAIPLVLKPNYDVKNSKDLQSVLSTWIADNNKGLQSDCSSCVVEDHTRFANKESWEGSRVGVDPGSVESKDNLLSSDDVESFLLCQKEAQPCIDDDKKKRIG